ncbi:MAG: MlaD family protein [Acidimicrobiales bacterium]|nr:MlaD family protein [Acidimicrobiales bacterium]
MTSISIPLVRRLIVGVLAASLLAVFLARPDGDKVQITAEFARAGLNVRAGDEVRVRGIPVGTISSIDVDREDFTARYVLSVGADTPIAADSTAALVPKTLFGDKYVSLDAASPTGQRLQNGAVIPMARTSAPSEVQEVLDRLQPVLDEVDPIAFSNVLASTAQGLDGHGDDLASVIDTLPIALETLIANQEDLGRIFRAVPGVAGTLAERSTELVRVADSFGTLAQTVDSNEGDLLAFVTDTAELSRRAAELLDAEEVRIDRILSDGLVVLDLVGQQPGAVSTLVRVLPQFVNGLAAATSTGAFRAPIANFAVLNPGSLTDGKGEFSEGQGGNGIGPNIEVEGLPIDGVTVGPNDPDAGLNQLTNGVASLLDNLLGGNG